MTTGRVQSWKKVHSNDLDAEIADLIESGSRITQVVMLANGYTFGLLAERMEP
jgi:hypothetical protein